jgi:hypothetical protein
VLRERSEFGRFLRKTRDAEAEDQMIGRWVAGLFTTVRVAFRIVTLGNLYYGGKFVLGRKMPIGNLLSIFGSLLLDNFALIELQTSLQRKQTAVAGGGRPGSRSASSFRSMAATL